MSRSGASWIWASLGLWGALTAVACEGPPARSKPWRHRGEVRPSAAPSRLTPALEEDRDRVEARVDADETLRIHVGSSFGHLNPMSRPTEWGRRIVFDTVFVPVIRYVPPVGGSGSGPGHYLPGVAESWVVSGDGREIVLRLDKSQQFHDGKRVTAVDVQFSIDMARVPRGRVDYVRPMLADISSVEIVSSSVVRVRMSKPNGYVLRGLAALPVVPQHLYGGRFHERGLDPVGSGPFRVVKHSSRQVILERWSEFAGPQPAVKRVVYRFEPDAAVALTALKSGEIDILPELIPAHYPAQARAPGIAHGFEPLRLAPPSFRFLALNHARAPFDDVRVRRALAHLIDRATIASEVWLGLAEPVPGPVWPGGAVDGAAPDAPAFDEKAAADLLAGAGWPADSTGVRRRLGQRLKLDVLVTDEDNPERERILSSFRRAGIATEVRVGSPAVLLNRLEDGDFDAAFISTSGLVDRDMRTLFASDGRENYSRVADPRIDAALDGLAQHFQPDGRARAAARLASVFHEQMPAIPLLRPTPFGLVSKRIRGVVPWDGWFSVRDVEIVAAPAK